MRWKGDPQLASLPWEPSVPCKVDCDASASWETPASSVEGGPAPALVANRDPCICHGVVVSRTGLVCYATGYVNDRRTM